MGHALPPVFSTSSVTLSYHICWMPATLDFLLFSDLAIFSHLHVFAHAVVSVWNVPPAFFAIKLGIVFS